MKTEAVRIEPELDGNVRVTVTKQAWPIVEGYMSRQRDGITDVLPPAPEKNDE